MSCHPRLVSRTYRAHLHAAHQVGSLKRVDSARRASGGTHPTLVRACSSIYEAAGACANSVCAASGSASPSPTAVESTANRFSARRTARRSASSFLRGFCASPPCWCARAALQRWQKFEIGGNTLPAEISLSSSAAALASLLSDSAARMCPHECCPPLALRAAAQGYRRRRSRAWRCGVFTPQAFSAVSHFRGLAVCGTRARTKASLSVFSPSNSSCRTSHPRADCVPHGPMPTWRLRTHRHSL